MTDRAWTEKAAATIAGGRYDECEAGHSGHAGRTVLVTLDGPTPVHEYPPIPADLARNFTMGIFDWEQYMTYGGYYCPGQDEVSKSIDLQGIWEGFETLYVLALLEERKPALVVDIGAHIGWYTLLAASCGAHVLAVDADPDHLHLLHHSADRNGWADLVTTCRAWIGADTPRLPVPDRSINLVKADIEGAEPHAVAMLADCLASGVIDNLLLEVSPIMGTDTDKLVDHLYAHGLKAWACPDKGCPRFTPLHEAEPMPQRNVLFSRDGAW